MTLTRNLFLAGAILAVGGFAATPASAMLITHSVDGVLVADDLQGYTVGSAPGGPWTTSVTHGGDPQGGYPEFTWVQVRNDTAGTVYNLNTSPWGNRTDDPLQTGSFPGAPGVVPEHTDYLAIYTLGRAFQRSSGSNYALNANHAAQTSGILNYEFMLNGEVNDGGRASGFDFRLGPEVGDGELYDTSLWRARISGRFINDPAFPDDPYPVTPRIGELRINGTNFSTFKTDTDGQGTGLFLTSNEWHKINISVDLDAGLFAVAVDDNWSSVFSLLGSGPISAVTLTKGVDQSHLFIGSTVPEPASLALIGIGGLLMLRRRQHG